MLSAYLDRACADRPLWLPELRAAFLADESARPLKLRIKLHDGSMRDFACAVPRWETAEEQRFAAEYLYACVYNILAVYSGRALRLFFDTADGELCALYESLADVFQLYTAGGRCGCSLTPPTASFAPFMKALRMCSSSMRQSGTATARS